MAQEIEATTDVEAGDIISKGMAEFEVVEIREEPDGFGPPFRAKLVSEKDTMGWKIGQEEQIGKSELLGGYEIID